MKAFKGHLRYTKNGLTVGFVTYREETYEALVDTMLRDVRWFCTKGYSIIDCNFEPKERTAA